MYNYLSYDEYVDFGGNLDPRTYMGYEFSAESTLNYYTYDRLTKTPLSEQPSKTQEAVKLCMFELIKLMQLKDSSIGLTPKENLADISADANVAEQENDGVRIRYNYLRAEDSSGIIRAKINEIISRSLSACTTSLGRKLLYRGLYPDE